jgi:CRP-like cAMP-binding protein
MTPFHRKPVVAPALKLRTNGHPAIPVLEIENSLLAALPHKEYQRIAADFEPVTLNFGDVLYEPGDAMNHVYFPGNALVSLLTLVDGHLALEVGLIGREGVLGVPLILGPRISPVRALVQGGGRALRMRSTRFLQHFRLSPALQKELYCYTFALMAQISQTAGCNRFHLLEQRLARWLLMTQDRVKSNEFRMTHEFLGHMLGVRRVGVTKAARSLQKLGLIRYTRGDITVVDRAGLEKASCRCYERVRDMHEQPGAANAARAKAAAALLQTPLKVKRSGTGSPFRTVQHQVGVEKMKTDT